jgi:hypothetical protein
MARARNEERQPAYDNRNLRKYRSVQKNYLSFLLLCFIFVWQQAQLNSSDTARASSFVVDTKASVCG